MNRTTIRTVLLAGALGVALLATACSNANSGSSSTQGSGPPSEQPVTPSASQDAIGATAGLTVGTTEGPYYISGTAELKNGDLNPTKLPGDPIKVSGYVYSGVGTSTPIPGAKVEIWHADSSGMYHPASSGSASQYPTGELLLRGYVLTDENGHYEFTSIYPGSYPGRTRHIHVRASVQGYGGVTTQIIVPAKSGDDTTPETDQIAQSLPKSYWVTFTTNNEVQETTFDFHLGAD